MARPHLGERVQILYEAPKVIVDTLSAHADALGLNFSQAAADLLAEATGHPEEVRGAPTLALSDLVRPPTTSFDGELATLNFRVPKVVADELDRLARRQGTKRPPVVTRLLAEAIGRPDLCEGVVQLALTG